MSKPERILVIRYRFIGDTILTVPFLRNLHQHYPEAKIDVLVGPQSGEVLQGCPYINDLIEFDTTRFHKYDRGEGKTKSFFYYAAMLRAKHYDLVFILKRSFSAALLSYLTGAKERIGYASGLKSLLLTTSVPWDQNKHEVESTLDILRKAKIPIIDDYLEGWTSAEEIAAAKALLPWEQKKYVLIHAAAAHPDKMYPSSHWARIIAKLHKENDFTAVLSGASADHALNQEIIDLSGVECINLAGQLSLRGSMALYRLMQLAICVDSGPSHLCAAVGTPTLAIFGPTDPVRWRPFGLQHSAIFDKSLSCRPCHYKKTCDDRRECLTELNPEIVIEQALGIYEMSHTIPRAQLILGP